MGLKIDGEVFTIKDEVYAVHKKYIDEQLTGASIVPVRVKTFKNVQGIVIPVLTIIGESKKELSYMMHYVYTNIDEAITAISIEKKKRHGKK